MGLFFGIKMWVRARSRLGVGCDRGGQREGERDAGAKIAAEPKHGAERREGPKNEGKKWDSNLKREREREKNWVW